MKRRFGDSFPPALLRDAESVAETSNDTSVAETSVAETSVAGTSVAETSVAETSVAETSVAETSVAETSVAETSVAETSVAKTSVAETSVAETSVAESSVAETPVAEISCSLLSDKPKTAIAELSLTTAVPCTKTRWKLWNKNLGNLRLLLVRTLTNLPTVRQLGCTIATVSSAFLPQFPH